MRWLLFALCFTSTVTFAVGTTPESVIKGLWRGLSHGPNQSSDVVLLEKMFHVDGVVYGAHYGEEGAELKRVTICEFLSSLGKVRETAFYECEVFRQIQRYDRFASVYSVVESRTDKQSVSPDFTGVNSIQLYKEGEQWKILSLYYQVENPEIDIPVQNGQSGKCLSE